MNGTLSDSLKTTSTMAGATRNQLDILKQEQADRTVQLAKKPKLRFILGGIPVPEAFNAVHPPVFTIREQSDTSMTFDASILNEGTASATKGQFRVVVGATDVTLTGLPTPIQAIEPPDNPFRTYLFNFDYIRPHVNMPVTLTFSFPKGRAPFTVVFNVDADEIETATPLGTVEFRPRTPTN